MNQKRILIVDDEESILMVLKNSLKKLGSDIDVQTATNGYEALGLLAENTFDLVVTDYKMSGMNGLELLEKTKNYRPETRVILMTAFGTSQVLAEAERLNAYQTLSKPLEIGAFRETISKALESIPGGTAGILILSDERYQVIVQILKKLQQDTGARCVLVANAEGQFIARVDTFETGAIEQIAALLGGGVSTLVEVGQILDKDGDAVNLIYREGKEHHLYALNVGKNHLMIILIDNSPYASRLGSVWYYAQQVAKELSKMLLEDQQMTSTQLFGGTFEETLSDQLNELFSGDTFMDLG